MTEAAGGARDGGAQHTLGDDAEQTAERGLAGAGEARGVLHGGDGGGAVAREEPQGEDHPEAEGGQAGAHEHARAGAA